MMICDTHGTITSGECQKCLAEARQITAQIEQRRNTEKPKAVPETESARIKEDLDQWATATIVSTTWKLILLALLLGFFSTAVLLWLAASNELLARLQTFNGALTIPVGGLTWAFAFTFVFLVPMKAMQILMCRVMKYNIEVSDRMLDVLSGGREELQKRGERMEAKFNKTLDDFRSELVDARRVAQDRHGTHSLFESFLEAMKEEAAKTREEIRGKRESAEGELEEALQEGEDEAAKIRGDGTTPEK